MPPITFPEFEDIKVSTRTFIAMTNLKINLETLFTFLPVLPPTGKTAKNIDFSELTPGDIISLQYKNKLRGEKLKPKKKKKDARWFRNSFTVEIALEDKAINFKVYSNGVFQITGCKTDDHAESCVKHIWRLIEKSEGVYSYKRNSEALEILFVPAMRNVDFSVGFVIDREKFTEYINSKTPHHALLETSYGYTGVNLKMALEKPITEMEITKLTMAPGGEWERSETKYEEYLSHLTPSEQNKKRNKERWITFLVFHSGRTILSSVTSEYSRKAYYEFVKIINESYDLIEERLITTGNTSAKNSPDKDMFSKFIRNPQAQTPTKIL